MSNYREEIEKIHNNTDFRVPFAGITEAGEFKYTNGSSVQAGLEYHVHYTDDKQEVFMTGGAHSPSSKIIERIENKSLFSTYVDLKGGIKDNYPQNVKKIPTPADYRIGYITRYFCKNVIDSKTTPFETNLEFFRNQSNIFEYVSFNWVIRGDKNNVSRVNIATIRRISKGIPGISNYLKILEFWRPAVGSQDYLQKKLSLRRIP